MDQISKPTDGSTEENPVKPPEELNGESSDERTEESSDDEQEGVPPKRMRFSDIMDEELKEMEREIRSLERQYLAIARQWILCKKLARKAYKGTMGTRGG
ncbi:hypothetical protein KR074_010949 [Drosophila pseudoananassae]|nr:hypothetical protein KR074_010949 [Drosophila pseudoananassae]